MRWSGASSHDAQGLGLVARDGEGGDGQVGAVLDVFGDQVAKIHAVELVAAEDQQVLKVMRRGSGGDSCARRRPCPGTRRRR